MEYIKLGTSELSVSRVGFGCWAIGGHGWGKVDDDESIRAVRKAMALGVNFFDTADVYGFGHSEEVLARALGPKRHEMVVATKVGVSWNRTGKTGRDLSSGYIRRAIDASLLRLRLESIPLYQVHWPDPGTPVAESMETLAELRKAGKVRNIGVSNFSREQLINAQKYGSIISLQAPMSLIDRGGGPVQDCRLGRLGVIAYGALGQGLFSGKYDAHSTFPADDIRSRYPQFRGPEFERNLQVLARVKEVAARHGKSPAQTAMRWVFDRMGADCVLAGIKRPRQIIEDCGSVGWRLSAAEISYLDHPRPGGVIDGQF